MTVFKEIKSTIVGITLFLFGLYNLFLNIDDFKEFSILEYCTQNWGGLVLVISGILITFASDRFIDLLFNLVKSLFQKLTGFNNGKK